MKVPDRLFKYQTFNSNSVENLSKHQFYFASPSELNDPYDCNYDPIISKIAEEEFEILKSQLPKGKFSYCRVDLEIKDPDNSDEVRGVCQHYCFIAYQTELLKVRNTKGVTSFTTKNNNLLMWSHYANQHKGFCLGFDVDPYIFSDLRKVDYSEEIPLIDVGKITCYKDLDQIMTRYYTKSADWSYEDEWRLLGSAKTKSSFDPRIITDVYFGSRCSDNHIDEIREIVFGLNGQVKFWKGKQHPHKFLIEFAPLGNS